MFSLNQTVALVKPQISRISAKRSLSMVSGKVLMVIGLVLCGFSVLMIFAWVLQDGV